MGNLKYIIILLLGLVLITCTREEIDTKVIETTTSLSFIEINNYLPTNASNLSDGYTKQSLTKVGVRSFKSSTENYTIANKKNKDLFFDSTKFTFLKKIERSSFLKKNSIDRIESNHDNKVNNEFPELKGKQLKLVSVSSKLDKKLFLTLEVPKNNSLNWSLIKIWTIQNENSQPQVHSVLFAKANNFESIAFKEGSVYLKENNLVYRVELDDKNRFHKKMNVFVSMFMETI